MIPTSFIQRIEALATAAGHFAVKTRFPNEQDPLYQLFRRGPNNWLACNAKDLRASPNLAWVASKTGGAVELPVEAMEAGVYEEIWSGSHFSKDPTLANVATVQHLSDVFGQASDPFVMQNISSFLGAQGLRVIRQLRAKHLDSVVAATVGPPTDLHIFASAPVLVSCVRDAFNRGTFSPAYVNYAKGAFAPIEQALKRLKQIRPATPAS